MTTATTFNLTAILFDDDTNVSGVEIRAEGRSLDYIQATLPGAKIPDTSPAKIELTREETLHLFDVIGKLSGLDPWHDVTGPMYDQLAAVVYSLMENEE